MDMYIGKRLDGRYEIEKLIGVGGMANVYKATDLLEHRPVAVKILRQEFLENEDLVRRFKNESKAIALLHHPHIVRVFDVSVSDKVQYIAMEYLDGATLKEYIEQRGVLSWKETLFFIEQVLGALQHAHAKGIIHRDIKPQNIMVLADGNIKVMDFGIARFARSESHTVTDKAIGSVHYISPEQAKGDVIDAKADIYSTGVMMYEMLTGKLPFDSESAVQVAIKQISDTAAPPRSINPDIPEPLEAITMKAMAKDARRRYQSADEMLGAIEEFKKNPSIKFAYDYLDDNSPTRYIDKVISKAKKTPPQGAQKQPKKKRNLTLPILAGMALAFAVGSAILCFLIFSTSGFFSSKPDVDLQNFVDLNYNDVKSNTEYTENFKLDVEKVYSATHPEGQIIKQSPKPPKKVKQGAKVKIWVSMGTEVVTVPDTAGKTRGEAEKALSKLGLSVLVVPEKSESVEAGKVIRTNPEPGTKLDTGSEITVYISKAAGEDKVAVPQLINVASTAEARKILESSRLSLGTPIEVESELPQGTILSQDPPAGTEVAVGTKVTVTIRTGVVAPKEKSVTVTVTFDANATASHWTATVGGTQVSAFDAVPGGVWSFTLTGINAQEMIITNGSTPIVATVDFQNPGNYNFQVNGPKPTPTPAPTPSPTPAPPVPTPSPIITPPPVTAPPVSPEVPDLLGVLHNLH